MSETAWFRRGDGAEFQVPVESEAYALLVAQGAIRLEGPAAEPAADTPADPLDGTKAEILAYAEAEGLEVDVTMSNNREDIVAAVKAAIEARTAAEGEAG